MLETEATRHEHLLNATHRRPRYEKLIPCLNSLSGACNLNNVQHVVSTTQGTCDTALAKLILLMMFKKIIVVFILIANIISLNQIPSFSMLNSVAHVTITANWSVRLGTCCKFGEIKKKIHELGHRSHRNVSAAEVYFSQIRETETERERLVFKKMLYITQHTRPQITTY
jgi:type III secretory pathway component EscR